MFAQIINVSKVSLTFVRQKEHETGAGRREEPHVEQERTQEEEAERTQEDVGSGTEEGVAGSTRKEEGSAQEILAGR